MIVKGRSMPFRFGFNFSNSKIILSVNSFDFGESKIKVRKDKRHIKFEVEEKPFVSEVGSKEEIDDKFRSLKRSSSFVRKRFSRFRSKKRKMINN